VRRMDVFDRRPPSDIEAEMCVLGCLILESNCLDEIPHLKERHFYDDANRRMFVAIRDLVNSGVHVDGYLLRAKLEENGDSAIVSNAKIAECAKSVPNYAHAVHYADIVAGKAQARAVLKACSETIRDIYASENEAEKTASRLIEKVESAIVGETDTIMPFSEVQQLALDEHDKACRGEAEQRFSTGIDKLDAQLGGISPGELVIVGARPGVGKTVFLADFAISMALQGYPVLWFSLEMTPVEIGMRFLASEGHVKHWRVRDGVVNEEEYSRVAKAAAEKLPIFLDRQYDITPADIRAKTRRMVRKEGVRAVVIDYLQLVNPNDVDARRARHEQVQTITKAMKSLALTFNIPVIMGCQLNRAAVGKEGEAPQLSHLRESGSIEQDANIVLLMHANPPGVGAFYEREGDICINIAKARSSQTGQTIIPNHEGFMTFRTRVEDMPNYVSGFDDYNAGITSTVTKPALPTEDAATMVCGCGGELRLHVDDSSGIALEKRKCSTCNTVVSSRQIDY
jgi:replicative DNA helicase